MSASEGFFCNLVCDGCGRDIEQGEWHTHDNENEESYCEDCEPIPTVYSEENSNG